MTRSRSSVRLVSGPNQLRLLATLLALLLIVFVQPWTESIVGLLAMVLPVMALSAWIAAGEPAEEGQREGKADLDPGVGNTL
jgi:type IV secretory pathway TrbD component